MQIIKTTQALHTWARRAHKNSRTVGLVPTMGALHEGHLSLIRAAKAACDFTAVSLFVNPTQFGPKEDFAKYPRTFASDWELLSKTGVDVLFAPPEEEMYPPGASTFVEVTGLSDRLDGKSRPGHFRGVATIVSKLFAAAEPDRAYFGQKDAAQIAVLRRMVTDLRLPVEIVVCPIVREADGLAMSSRNRFLSVKERGQALVLCRAVSKVQQLHKSGTTQSAKLIAAAQSVIATQPAVRVDYIAAVDWATLEPVEEAVPGTLFAVAAWVGETRLIDNVIL
jgi:pantoate--beta-alanine ligase